MVKSQNESEKNSQIQDVWKNKSLKILFFIARFAFLLKMTSKRIRF